MKRMSQTVRIAAVEGGGDGREGSRDVEDDRGLFVGERVLGDGLLGEGVVPHKADADIVFVDRETKVEKFELAVIAVQKVTARSVFTGSAGVLS